MSEADRIKWDAKYRERGEDGLREIDPFLASLDDSLPRAGRALDVAGGAGRHAIWLARRGLEVTLVDVSPVGLGIASRIAEREGLRLETQVLDLTAQPLPEGPWDLILSFHYLQRSLFEVFPRLLAPGGLLVFCQPTRTNLERHAHPSARFLLEDGELPSLVKDLEVVSCAEGWSEAGRHEARLVARRPADRA